MTLWYALIDLLPFQWAEPGKMYFMKNALLAILVISPLFGLLSTMVVEKRTAFFRRSGTLRLYRRSHGTLWSGGCHLVCGGAGSSLCPALYLGAEPHPYGQ